MLQAEFPDREQKELFTVIAQRWNSISEKEKEVNEYATLCCAILRSLPRDGSLAFHPLEAFSHPVHVYT